MYLMVLGVCLMGVFRVSGDCLEGDWKVFDGCVLGIKRMFAVFKEGVLQMLKFVWTPNIFEPSIFGAKNLFGCKYFLDSQFLGPNICLDTNLWNQHFSGKHFLTQNCIHPAFI